MEDVTGFRIIPSTKSHARFAQHIQSMEHLTDVGYFAEEELICSLITSEDGKVEFLDPDSDGRNIVATYFLNKPVKLTIDLEKGKLILDYSLA